MPYTGGPSTGATRASLQRALDNYKTGHINLPVQGSESDLGRSDTVSFGESHASELSSINSESSLSVDNVTPLSSTKPLPASASPQLQAPPIDVASLNLSPAPLPTSAVETVSDPAQTLPPTIAETGIPVTSDNSNPGPSSGSLLDIRRQGSAPVVEGQKYGSAEEEKRLASASLQQAPTEAVAPVEVAPAAATTPPVVEGQKYESAEDEKKRLAAERTSTEAVAPVEVAPAVQGPSQVAATVASPQSESAEEEKKRLEREARQRILQGDQNPSSKGQEDSEELPPYEEPK
jgi:hypothetical protein